MNKEYVSISVLNNYLKQKFDMDTHLQKVYLKGEISNFKNHTRGHLYFTLKDETSRLSAVMFASSTKNLKFIPEDGMKVLVEGKISVYEANGSYQIYVEKMDVDGVGNLFLAYEELKKKLSKEGLFDESHKVSIPKYPNKIGIITASTGAAVKDILSTIKRRYPIANTILFPTLVQGDGAKENIVKQLKKASEFDLDVIILGRGGGSIEDLWAFNEEIVARAIYECPIPIISAVGHEIDFTIADFVADLRAPTPTGAAEMAVPNLIDLNIYINNLKNRSTTLMKNLVNQKYINLKNLKNNYILKNPLSIYENLEQKLSFLIENCNQNINNIINKNNHRYELLNNQIIKNSPLKLCEKYQIKIDNYINSFNLLINNYLNDKNYQYNILINKVELLNPLSILKKGYSIIKFEDKVIDTVNCVKVDDLINIRLKNGQLKAIVKEIENER